MWKYLGLPLSYIDNIHIVDKKKPQFASSAETTWQVILFKFDVVRCKLPLHYVVNK